MNRQIKKRWVVIVIGMVVLMSALIAKLYDLSIKQGAHYRQISDTKRVKEIEISAPRGNIYDCNGVLLAGTRSSFAVQGYKDDLSRLTTAEQNETLLQLIRYIERDGVDYLSGFPLSVNTFVYQNDELYFTEKQSPRAAVEKVLREKNLVGEWLSLVYSAEDGYAVSMASRARTALSLKGASMPVSVDPDQRFALSFDQTEEYNEWVRLGKIADGDTPLSVLTREVQNNENLLTQVLNHPAARRLAFEVLEKHGLTGNIRLEPYAYTYRQEGLQNKANLHRRFPAITRTSDPKSDFIEIVKSAALNEFLTSSAVDGNNKFVIPAERLINALDSKGIETNLTYEIAKNGKTVTIKYDREEQTLEVPIDRLKRLSEENGLLEGLIVEEQYKDLAQQAIFAKGIYPRISTTDWTYGYDLDEADFEERFELKNETAEQAFDIVRKRYEVEASLEDIEALGIMCLMDRIDSQGNYAFAPVNLCYELSPKTVAKIEENIPTSSGIVVSVEPIRFYPYGESACHILGYIGKISTDEEIKKYVENGGYLPDDVVGKTGVEESFEDTLHGVNGKQTVLVDSYGNRTETLQTVEPKAGNNLYLTIDITLQQASEKNLRNTLLSLQDGMPYYSKWGDFGLTYSPYASSGATISTDPGTGALLAMASYPAYDPNLFVTGISYTDWDSLMPKDEDDVFAPRPLINVATQMAVQPGSVFKPFVGLTALEKGFSADERINCQGYIDVGDQRFQCLIWAQTGEVHGSITLAEAIEVSCNYFFYVLGLGDDPRSNTAPSVKVTVEDIQQMAERFGLTETSGLEINYPQESVGNVPSSEGKLGISKQLLAYYLEPELIKYKKEDVFKNQEAIEADIRTIISWLDRANEMGRTEIISLLEDMGYNAETPLADSYSGLADIIKYNYLIQADWSQADAAMMVIGQGQNAYTPIEINRYCSIIANGGTRYQYTLLKEIRSHDDKTVVYAQRPNGTPIELSDPANMDTVRRGMQLSAQYGAAAKAYQGLGMSVGSKTGTAEHGGTNPKTGGAFDSYSWYMAFAPFDNPKICTTTFLSQAGTSSNAIPMTRDIMAQYLGVPTVQEGNDAYYDSLENRLRQESESSEESSSEAESAGENSGTTFVGE
ncbi:MAG: penicillin-binding transpeptidase domain-containing protein [Ndongobacter sp.]|nr:penicillin-binding transpeptidase domain-containing protein [Ndongobacter sp.]